MLPVLPSLRQVRCRPDRLVESYCNSRVLRCRAASISAKLLDSLATALLSLQRIPFVTAVEGLGLVDGVARTVFACFHAKSGKATCRCTMLSYRDLIMNLLGTQTLSSPLFRRRRRPLARIPCQFRLRQCHGREAPGRLHAHEQCYPVRFRGRRNPSRLHFTLPASRSGHGSVTGGVPDHGQRGGRLAAGRGSLGLAHRVSDMRGF